MANAQGNVARILYKEIIAGDLRKINAESNDADTGGGARDFRFGSYLNVAPIIQRMFPVQTQETRRRNGALVPTTIYSGTFYWTDSQGMVGSAPAFFEPPTDARSSEGRIARVHEQPCLADSQMPSLSATNRVFLLLTQLVDDTVWPEYIDEQTIRNTGSRDPVTRQMLGCIDAPRRHNHAVIGFCDFLNGGNYCNSR